MKELIIKELVESAGVFQKMAADLPEIIVAAARIIIDTLKANGKLLLIGNGGSAADAQHIAAELVGRFKQERAALPAIALTANTSVLTALANDYAFKTVFSRQLEGLGSPGDTLLAITTSGTSPNILKAAMTARSMGVKVIGLTGRSGGKLKDLADLIIMVPSADTPRIQEAHIAIGHSICLLVEKELFGNI